MAGESMGSPDGISTCHEPTTPLVASNLTVAGINIPATVSQPDEELTRTMCGPEKMLTKDTLLSEAHLIANGPTFVGFRGQSCFCYHI